MIGDIHRNLTKSIDFSSGRKASKNSGQKTYHAYGRCRLDGGLLEGEGEELVRLETSISYKPREDQPKYVKLGGYLVRPRLTVPGIRTRYASWEDYAAHAEEDPIQAMVKEWTYIGPEWFELARANAGVTLEIGVDYVRYNEHLKGLWREKYGEEPPPDVRLLSYEIEGEASLNDYVEAKKGVYKEGLRRNAERAANKDKK